MYFEDLHRRMIAHLLAALQRGDLTERGLARLAGLSQPHLHNVLNGSRRLSNAMADQILRRLKITLLDLLTPDERPLCPALCPARPAAEPAHSRRVRMPATSR